MPPDLNDVHVTVNDDAGGTTLGQHRSVSLCLQVGIHSRLAKRFTELHPSSVTTAMASLGRGLVRGHVTNGLHDLVPAFRFREESHQSLWGKGASAASRFGSVC